jgi:hypothetical protein
MQIRTVDLNKLRGVSDKFLGLGKEAVGVLLSNERLQREGEAQQERAAEQLKALRKELEAEQKDATAGVLEQRQRAAQRAKDR